MLVNEIKVGGQRLDDDSSLFPLVLECPDETDLSEAVRWIESETDALVAQAAAHGAVLFRGFPVVTDRDFDEFIRAFQLPNFTYEDSLSNAVRTNRTERVFTANEAPADVLIRLHHEMAQTPVYPSKLFFFCEQAADSGGATPLCRSDVLYDRMQNQLPEFARDCEQKGLLYSHVMPAVDDAASGMGRSWQSTWKTESRDEAEARMTGLGYSWEWLGDGCLKVTTPRLPPFESPCPLSQDRVACRPRK